MKLDRNGMKNNLWKVKISLSPIISSWKGWVLANIPNLTRGKRLMYQAPSLSNLACLFISDRDLDIPDRSSLLSVLTNALPPNLWSQVSSGTLLLGCHCFIRACFSPRVPYVVLNLKAWLLLPAEEWFAYNGFSQLRVWGFFLSPPSLPPWPKSFAV